MKSVPRNGTRTGRRCTRSCAASGGPWTATTTAWPSARSTCSTWSGWPGTTAPARTSSIWPTTSCSSPSRGRPRPSVRWSTEFNGLLPAGAWPAWMLGNHDVSRIASRYDEGGNGQAGPGWRPCCCSPCVAPRSSTWATRSARPTARSRPTGWSTSTAATPSAPRCSGTAPPAPASVRRPLAAGRPRGGQGQRRRPARRPGLHVRPVPPAHLVPQGLRRPAAATTAPWPTPPAAATPTCARAGDERLLVALNFTGQPLEYEVDGPETGRLELATDPARPLGDPVGLRPLRLGPDEGVVVRL